MPDYSVILQSEQGRLLAAQLLLTWIRFREGHDIESERLSCCADTRDLFNVLHEYEKLMLGENYDAPVPRSGS